ncbi:unnamed protein product [Meloidogyne enterolobii]|uniref:Uncharacterized protein n=1 Tax=Meloidogyne enterolobii TaxID=390850 RepID=A0ACB0YUK2_MELEN
MPQAKVSFKYPSFKLIFLSFTSKPLLLKQPQILMKVTGKPVEDVADVTETEGMEMEGIINMGVDGAVSIEEEEEMEMAEIEGNLPMNEDENC